MFRSQLTQRLLDAFTSAQIEIPEGFAPSVVLASDTRFGDYQSNTAMALGKHLRTNPRALAQTIADHLKVDDLCEKISVDGPGFLNFTISKPALQSHLCDICQSDRFGVPTVTEPRNIVIDFSAPNVAKPMHVGHIRSTFIGDSLARVARFLGHHVTTDNHIGDWGTQFGMILHGWKTLLDHDALAKDPIHELVRVYKIINAAAKDDESLREVCKAELVKLQQGDAENHAIWTECVRLTMIQLDKVYDTLGVTFDYALGESYYNDALGPLVDDLLAKGIASVSEGAVVVFSDGSVKPEEDPFLTRDKDEWKAAPCIVRKSDGGFLYPTTDLATIDYRINEWKADEIWYVVGQPQQLHFRHIIAVTQRRGIDVKLVHVAFGSIQGEDGKMFKTRSGETVGLLEVIDEAIDRARTAAAEKDPSLSGDALEEIARIIGCGAVKYAELSQNRMTDYKFAWDRMLSLQGNTAPYLINAYVRTRAIFRKLGEDFAMPAALQITEDAERGLAMKLAQFAEATHDILIDHRPNTLATYLFELADCYHSFYEACHVLNSTGITRDTRLTLCQATSRVLKQGLNLLGIQTTERM
ncbi:MAG: arginine--tRNA ligase [Verrucomicrobiaceae bacterium]|nr:arginine--tRNA ligase [Verrucomicrobiaceae bacterium]